MERQRRKRRVNGRRRSGDTAKSAGSSHSLPGFNILMRFWNRRFNKERQSDGERQMKREREAFFNNENWPEISQEQGGGRERLKDRIGCGSEG